MFTKLRPYQQDIVDIVMNTDKSTLIQVPTGGGKTLISKEIAIKLINNFNKQVLFIAPKIILMKQTAEVFKGLRPHILHGNSKYDKNHTILISTIQTASRRDINPDVIIIDEIHYGYNGTMREALIKDKPNLRIIGLSATPYDQNGYLLKGFDVILNKYDMKYMIQNNYLVPIRSFILVKPDLSKIKIIAGDYAMQELSEVVSKNKIILEIVKTSKPFIDNANKVIVFAVDINHAELLKVAFLNEGYSAESVHSKLTDEQKNIEIERFKRGYTKVLVSVLMLTTGFDVPETDLAIIARPTKSQNLYKQMVGRVARLFEGKKYATLLDCGNVIENLGKPLDPIKEKEELEKTIQKLLCKECNSENIKLKKDNDCLFWECQDCGYKKELEKKNYYECENCRDKYSFEGDFELVNNKLYLNCKCGYETLISEFIGNENFVEVASGIDIDTNINIPDAEVYEEQSEYLSFEEAKNFVAILELETELNWQKYCNNEIEEFKEKPMYIPRNPHFFYKEWISWNDWLTSHKKNTVLTKTQEMEDKEDANTFINSSITEIEVHNEQSEYLPFEEAKKFILNLKLDSLEDWLLYIDNKLDYLPEKPSEIPNTPSIVYRGDGWISWDDWLFDYNENTKSKVTKKQYLPFKEARSFVHNLKLGSIEEWRYYSSVSLPDFIPENPKIIYKKEGWWGLNDWLGI